MRLVERLYKKGWSIEELEHFHAHWEAAKKNNERGFGAFVDLWMYWIMLFCLIFCIIAYSQFFFPLLTISFVPPVLANMATALIAGVFGVLFGHVLHDIDYLEHSHHALILVVAAVTTLGSSRLVLGMTAGKSISLGVLFVICFSIMYGFYWWRSREIR